ncbi:hypothetical protein NHQ30_003550 [Ciborinia camelliae]|nr:hypothetical protein NHQ30_003550 [Ciborinia camelliae]
MVSRSSKPRDSLPSPGPFNRPPPSQYYTYRIQRGEQGVLTYEPYKSYLLPLWRFRTPSIAEKSSTALYEEFPRFYSEDDFVGMDMSRKFIQMGMTRSKRYANHQGGRKYQIGKDGEKVEKEKSRGHHGQEEKLIASGIFKEMWERCREHEGYKVLKGKYQKDLKNWIQDHGKDTSKEGKDHKVEKQERNGERKHIKKEEEEEEIGGMNSRPRKKPQGEGGMKETPGIKEEENTLEMSSKPRKKRKISNL